jgi:hypothetical protein
MPAKNTHDARQSDGAIRAAVIRLSRPDNDGGAVIERAAIMAEGAPAAAIEAWILQHGGEPEAPTVGTPAPGLYGLRPDSTLVGGSRAPRRYVLPATALAASR